MSTKIVIDNVSGSLAIDGTVRSAPVPSEAGATLISNSSNQWVSQAVPTSWRNRLINGDMAVSQRNGDAFVSPTSSGVYTVDRWRASSDITNGYSVYFDGTGDYLTAPDNAAFAFGTGDFTIEAWVYPTGARHQVIYTYAAAAGGLEVYFALLSTNFVNGSLRNASGTVTLIASNAAVSLNTWTHLAFTRQSGTLYLYVNGVRQSQTSNASGQNMTGGATPTIGALRPSTTANFLGYISNLRIVKGTAVYTSNFTPSTIPLTAIANTSLLACAGPLISTDKSSNNFTISVTGNAQLTQSPPFSGVNLAASAGRETGYSNYFDGSGDYLQLADNAAFQFGTGNFTIEAWVNLSSTASNQRIFSYQPVAGGDPVAVLSYYTGGFAFFMRTATTPIQVIYSNALAVTNRWYHVAAVRQSGTMYLYIDGVRQSQTASSSHNIPSGGIPVIGALPGVSPYEYFNGYISNLRIVKGTALYTANFTPSTTPLVPVSGTSLLTCASSTFADKSSNNFTVTPAGNAVVSAINPFTQAGFGRSLRWAVSTPGAPISTNQALIQQRIEGSNIYDFSWGTPGARTATLSFWVNSPIAGTYCAAIQNSALNRSYVAEYTVSAANTWERKTVVIPGPTSGDWSTDNSEGLRVCFDMGSGTNYNTTAGAWQVGNFTRTSGALSFSAQALVSSSLSNNFYVTGVQLELGSVATPYEMIPYGKQLESCQRYFARMGSLSGNNVGFGAGATWQGGASAGRAMIYMKYPQQMRSVPTIAQSGTAIYNTQIRALSATPLDSANYGTDSLYVNVNTGANTQTVGQGVLWTGNSSTAYVDLDAEL